MKKNKRIIFVICILLLIILGGIFVKTYLQRKNKDSEVIIMDNVFIITEDKEIALDEVTEDTLIFSEDIGFVEGDIIVSGITDIVPNGYIRKIISVSENNGVYEYKTQPAVLTEVFEEAHVIKTFAITNEEVKDIDEINDGVMELSSVSNENNIIQSIMCSELEDEDAPPVKIKPSENGIGLILELKETIGDSFEASGQVEVNTYLELKIDIEDGEIDFGIAVHTDTDGELFVGLKKKLFDEDDKDKFNGEYEKELIKKALPNIQFMIGPVPIVITNDFMLSAEVSAQLEGSIGTTIGVDAERVSGFEYSSKTGTIKEINERNYFSDGIEWKTEAKATGELEAGIYVHLITKLYGSTGADLSVGIAGDLYGELALGVDEKLNPELYGSLALSVAPKVSGKIVVSYPVIDYDLIETEILKVSLPTLWEKKWEVPDPMLIAMEKGNFSCFAGDYVATPESNDACGGGQKLNPLEVKKDGSLMGGSSFYSEGFYPNTKPVAVVKNTDGTYRCTINDNCYYIIYPVGIIEERDYVLENQAYLKDVVYIRCFVFDGGVLDVTYYSDSIADIVIGYDGDDWVSQKALEYEVGEQLISGTNIEYKVVAVENNSAVGGGRERIILETQDGKRWMIPNFPAHIIDMRTGIMYYNIYPYRSNPDYVEEL